MRYKIGDRVQIKSLDWYNENKDEYGDIDCGNVVFLKSMQRFCGRIVTIIDVNEVQNIYTTVLKKDYLSIENHAAEVMQLNDEMIEGLVKEETKPKFKVGDRVITNKGYIGKFEGWVSDYQVRVLFEESGCNVVIHPKDLKLAEEETKPNVIEEAKTYWDGIKDAWICPEGYIFKDENDNVINTTKIVLEKKKKEYPKTYEECCKILDITPIRRIGDIGYKRTLLNVFEKLLICRDAYWKIAGEEMGLEKPWESDWTSGKPFYCISVNGNIINKGKWYIDNKILAFPIEEMRDAFYEAFKEEIEICKELL